MISDEAKTRFWSKVNKTDTCWLWTAYRLVEGYGQIRINGKIHRTHRLSYLIAYGDFSPKLSVLHKCDVPACVNPAHLFLGTLADNNLDMTNKGRRATGKSIFINRTTTKLTDVQVVCLREDFINLNLTQAQLAKKYGISQSVVSRIVNKHSWK